MDPAIEVTGALPDGVTYKFPRRDLSRGRPFVWMMIGLTLGIAYWMLAAPIARLTANFAAPASVFSLVFWSILTFFLLRFPIWIGISLHFGHREIELRGDSLCTTEHVGFLRRGKCWPLDRVRRLQIVKLLPIAPLQGELVDDLHMLTGVLEDSKRIVIAPIYPRRLLVPFAEQLTAQMSALLKQSVAPAESGTPQSSDASTLVKSAVENAPPIEIQTLLAEVVGPGLKPGEIDIVEQPPGSDVQAESFPDGITLRVPPAGVWKGSAGLFQFGIGWSVLIGAFTLLFLVAGVFQGAAVSGIPGLFAVMGVLCSPGAAMMYFGWRMGTRESVVAIVAGNLMVMQTTGQRVKRKEWPQSEIQTIRVGPSDIEKNDEPVPELQIMGPKGKLFGMLAGRDPRELGWMATMLRQGLQSAGPSRAPDGAPRENARAPAAKRHDIDYAGMTIDERLLVARLRDTFADAVRRQDRPAMLDLLRQIDIPEAGGGAYADAVLADPQHYGY